VISSNELNLRLDDELRDALDDYAARFFKKPNGYGNRSEAARHVLASIFKLQKLPPIASILEDEANISLNGDIIILIRFLLSEHIKADADHTLQ
jgi:hypothetical protein